VSQFPVMSVQDIRDLSFKALVGAGASDKSGRSLSRAIAAAERDGISSHGLAYLPTYCEHVLCGKVDGQATPLLERGAPSLLLVDAQCGFAHPAIDLGFNDLIPLAREQGIAALAIRNSYNCGCLGYHTERLAEAGLVGIGFTNSPASIAPTGARNLVVGTNPWSIAVPNEKNEAVILVDQSASVVAKSEVLKRARQQLPIPSHWAFDADGQETTDAEAALKGSMAPSGGYKGVNAAIFVEVMAACLTGATLGMNASPYSGPTGGPPRTGQFFIAISPSLSSNGVFIERLNTFVTELVAQPGARLPGARRKDARAMADAQGVEVDPAILLKIDMGLANAGVRNARL
jgi:(2R)-3-sulfolactate dehydrogenase (NADP+)